jgi:DNA-binding MarR family transcriptional regulator
VTSAHVKKEIGEALDYANAAALRLAVVRIYRTLRIHADRNITASQGSALARIEKEGTVRVGVLAQLEGITPASMSKIVDSLENRNLIERIPDSLDGRASVIQMSDGGRELFFEIRSASTEMLEGAISSLSDDERGLLRQSLPVLEKISETLQVK